MRLLFLNFTYPRTGTYLRALAFAELFRARGHVVNIVSPSPWRRFRPDIYPAPEGAEIHTPKWVPFDLILPQDGWSPIDIAWRIGYVATQHRYDLVYCFDHKPSTVLPALVAKYLRGIPAIYDWCDWWGGPDGQFRGYVEKAPEFGQLPAPKRITRKLAFRRESRQESIAPRKFDAVTVISDALLNRGRELGVEPMRLARVYTPSPLDRFDGINKKAARERLKEAGIFPASMQRGDTLLGMAANVVHDAEILFPAFQRLLEARPGVHLILTGHGFDDVPAWMKEGPLSGRLSVAGMVEWDRYIDAMVAADLVLCPLEPTDYNRGRFPHKIYDYAAAGKPMLVTNVGDIGSLVPQYNAGLVHQAGADFASLLIEGVDAPDRWAEWGVGARRMAEQEFAPDRIAAQLNRLIVRTTGLETMPD